MKRQGKVRNFGFSFHAGPGLLEEVLKARADYRAAIDAGNFASACIACGRCEDVCPQNIEIISQLRECVTALEP